MTLDDFCELAAGMDLDAIEPTAYYFPGTSPEYLAQLKGHCTRLGLDISGTAIGNRTLKLMREGVGWFEAIEFARQEAAGTAKSSGAGNDSDCRLGWEVAARAGIEEDGTGAGVPSAPSNR